LDSRNPRFQQNLSRHLQKLLNSFGISENYEFRRRFPVDKFINDAMTDIQLLISKDYFDGNAIEFHVMAIFDQFQRKHLNNVFQTHPEMRVFRLSAKTTSLDPPTLSPSTKQLILENDTGITDLSTVRLSSSKLLSSIRASSPASQLSDVSDSDRSGSGSSKVSKFNTAHPHWRDNIRNYAYDRMISAMSNPEFDIEGFNKTFEQMILSNSEPMKSSKMETLVGHILDYYVRKCSVSSNDAHSVSSDSIVSVHPPVPARQLLDLTRDSGESPTSPVHISAITSALPANPRDRPLITIPQDRPFGAARSGIFNHRLEEGRLNDIIDVLEKQKILTLIRRFRSYRGQGGLYPLSSFVDAW
jgi:hypothetical protein